MGFILLIVAAILYFAGPWFDGQDTVAIVLAVAGVIAIVLQFTIFAAAGAAFRRESKSFKNQWDRW